MPVRGILSRNIRLILTWRFSKISHQPRVDGVARAEREQLSKLRREFRRLKLRARDLATQLDEFFALNAGNPLTAFTLLAISLRQPVYG